MKIDVVNVVRRFGSFAALDGIALEIGSGELVALLGPSGSGKTTLLRIIAGLDWPDTGEIWFDGKDALGRTVGERRVGFVFQHYALFHHMSVFDNVAFGLRVRPRRLRQPEEEIRKRVGRLLELVQIGWLAHRYPSQLSGGERQRVALARALAIKPRVLLLDEPFGSLDAKVRKDLRRWLRNLHDEKIQVTSLFVTHDQEEALEVADRIVVMNRGRIEQTGTPEEVYAQPATAFVHGFIGESISIPVVIGDAGLSFAGRPIGLDATGVAPGPGLLFVRPYDMAITAAEGAALTGEVKRVHGIGPARRVEIALSGGEARVIEVDPPRALDVHCGETVGLRPRHYRVFPAPADG